ncbi:MAG: hypothetical protein IPO06_19620 [Leptospiraceae bacterium]|nr:hypothetical protein [Leptospiraceae bacterium]
MANHRKILSKELEDKAANLGTILKERKIALDGGYGRVYFSGHRKHPNSG